MSKTKQIGPDMLCCASHQRCGFCTYHDQRMIHSGLDPLYEHTCMHPEYQGGRFIGRRYDHTPTWCPVLNSGE